MTTLSQMTIVLVLLAAAPVWAQTPRADGPFAGLFGGRGSSEQSLDLRGSLYGAYQRTDLPAEADADQIDPRFRNTGIYEGASAGLSYFFNRAGQDSSLFFGGRGSVSQSSVLEDIYPYSAGANFGISSRLTRRMRFSAGADATYSPYYGFGIGDAGFIPDAGFAGDPALIGQAFGAASLDQPTVTTGAQVGLSLDLSRRTSISADGNYQRQLLLDTELGDTRSYGGRVTLRHQLTRSLTARAGYGRQMSETDMAGADPLTSDVIDAGVDYSGNFSLGRRTTVTLGSSSTLVRNEGDTHFRLNGAASLNHGMGRSWQLSTGYTRDVGFVAGFREPVLSDSAQAALSGLLGPRLSWSSGATWTRGELGFDSGEAFVTYGATTSLHVALFRALGAYASYGYHVQEVPRGSSVLELLSKFSRHSASVGVSTHVPIFSTGRRARDPR